ncbi:MAG: BsuPI-related putative proteinase inhibitor [Gemmatimonadota bacterium]
MRRNLRLVLLLILLAPLVPACEPERTAPTAPAPVLPDQVIIRLERLGGPGQTDDVLTIDGRGQVTFRDLSEGVAGGAVALLDLPVAELLSLEREFDAVGWSRLRSAVSGGRCAECATYRVTRGVGAGERTVQFSGRRTGLDAGPLRLLDRLEALISRALAARRDALGGGGTAHDRLSGGLDATLAVGRAVVRPGEPLYLQLTLQNVGSAPLRLDFAASRLADFRIEALDGTVVWRLARERAQLAVASAITLAPGERRTFEEVWQGRTQLGSPAETGSYLAVGVVPARQGGETPPVAFQVRGAIGR